ncbi:unnamed protein product [Moneuplotes crassus]|uniref:Uncharacterized protein n=1 Tax=Euplotes crassus TaxID=5936 RepID=A0AAD1XSA3_EUPCR|nr:unnamed protein product [Moneuplotes crassus]
MEHLSAKVIPIPYRISLLSVIIPYYGYVNECAELFLQLDKKSRSVWEANLKPILDVILNYKQCTLVKDIQKSFTLKVGQKLLAAETYWHPYYLYFSLKVYLQTCGDFKAMMWFMDEMKLRLKHQFYKIHIKFAPRDIQICNEFLRKYLQHGFNPEAVLIDDSCQPCLLQKLRGEERQCYFGREQGWIRQMYHSSYFGDIELCWNPKSKKESDSLDVDKIVEVLEKEGKSIRFNYPSLRIIEEQAKSEVNFKHTNNKCRTIKISKDRCSNPLLSLNP